MSLHDENFKVQTTINDKDSIVVVNHVTKSKDHGLVDCKWTFDFSECTDRELLGLAARTLVIDARPAFKNLNRDKLKDLSIQVIDVHEFVNRERTRSKKSPLEQAQSHVDKLTPEERQALLAQLEGMQNQELDSDSAS